MSGKVATPAGFAGRIIGRKISEDLILNRRRELPESLFFLHPIDQPGPGLPGAAIVGEELGRMAGGTHRTDGLPVFVDDHSAGGIDLFRCRL